MAGYSVGATQIVTKEGECKITLVLELNINLNNNGINVIANAVPGQNQDEKTNWVIPEFSSEEKIKFGKTE